PIMAAAMTVDIVGIAVAMAIARLMAIAVFAAGDRIARETTGDTTDHRASDTVRGKAADQRTTTCAQRRAGVMGAPAASVGSCADCAGGKNNGAGRGEFGKVFHSFLHGLSSPNVKEKRAAKPIRSEPYRKTAKIRQAQRLAPDSPYSLMRRRNRKSPHSIR